MGGLIGKVLLDVLVKKATKSVTSYIGAAAVAGGVATTVDPQLLSLIPEQYRAPALAVLGVAIVLARHRQDITAMYSEAKAAVDVTKTDSTK